MNIDPRPGSFSEFSFAPHSLFKLLVSKFTPALAALALLCLMTAGCHLGNTAGSSGTAAGSKPIQSAETFVLVHGAWGGGWDWRNVADRLSADGYRVYRPTLTGQGEHVHLSSTNVDLETHIEDIVNLILWEDLHDVVLVGHSYGGMVITGVADRVPDRIRRVVYLDALLPENGECVNEIIPPKIQKPIVNGYVIPVWVKGNPPPPHDVPMPAGTFTHPITLTNQAAARQLNTTYILTADAGQTPESDDFYKFFQRAQTRHWPTWIMTGDHNVQRSHPAELVELLEKAAK